MGQLNELKRRFDTVLGRRHISTRFIELLIDSFNKFNRVKYIMRPVPFVKMELKLECLNSCERKPLRTGSSGNGFFREGSV